MRLFNAAQCLGLLSGTAFQALQHPVAHAGRTKPSKHEHCSEDEEPPQQGRYYLRSHRAAADSSSAAGRPPQHPSQLRAQQHAEQTQQWRSALSTEHAEQLRSSQTQQQQQRRASRDAAQLAAQQAADRERKALQQQSSSAEQQQERTDRHKLRDLPVACKPLSNVPQHTLPSRTDECQHCGALLCPSEYDKRQKSSSLCCMHGKVDLQHIFPQPAPQPLLKFFRDASDSTAQHFRQHTRAYNSSLCMASTLAPPSHARWAAHFTCTLAATPVLLCCQHSRGLWPRGDILVIIMHYSVTLVRQATQARHLHCSSSLQRRHACRCASSYCRCISLDCMVQTRCAAANTQQGRQGPEQAARHTTTHCGWHCAQLAVPTC